MADKKDSILTKFFKSLLSVIKWFFIIFGFIVFTMVFIQLFTKPSNPVNLESMIYRFFDPTNITAV